MADVADSEAPFGRSEWALVLFFSLTGGSAFLFMSIGLDHFPPATVTALRVAGGAVTLALFPAARRPVPRLAWRLIVPLGLLWIALPLTLFPVAQRTIPSSLAGMINAAVPLSAAGVAALIGRRLPPVNQCVGLLIGFTGVVVITVPTLRPGSALAFGTILVVLAVLSYGIAFSIAAPLQRTYGALPVIFRAELVALVLVAPAGIAGLPDSSPTFTSVVAMAFLGCAGTGLVFAALTVLAGRVGAARGSIGIYFTPIVAIVLGVLLRGEHVTSIHVTGTALVIFGAWVGTWARPHRGGRPGHGSVVGTGRGCRHVRSSCARCDVRRQRGRRGQCHSGSAV